MPAENPSAPAEIFVSIGTAAVLGLSDIRMEVAPTTAYLMLGGRCAMNCGFCAQARESHASALNLSRVTWPPFPLHVVTGRLATAGTLRRICIQVTVGREAYAQTLAAVRALHAASPLPIDVAILPTSLEEVQELVNAGVDHIGFGLDAACERVFRLVKTGLWDRSIEMIERTAQAFPGRAAVHLIVGLGETEREMAEMIQYLHDRGITIGLFAFTPVRGTELESRPAPSLGHYRRMQAARHLIVHDLARLEQMSFDSTDRLVRLAPAGWRSLLGAGSAFLTSGCPDCNRPYYNERPAGPMFNYARPLLVEESCAALGELELNDIDS